MVVTLSLYDDDLPDGPLVRDDGSVVVLAGRDEYNDIISFAADHRIAQDILSGLEADGGAECYVATWQVISSEDIS